MYYLLEDNRIIDSTNEKDISKLKWDYNCEFHNGKIYFYKPRNNYNCEEACGRRGSFCIGCKDAFKAKFNKIKKQSENVFELIEEGDLIKDDNRLYEVSEISDGKKDNGRKSVISQPAMFKHWEWEIEAIYKPNSNGDYIKVWEKKNE